MYLHLYCHIQIYNIYAYIYIYICVDNRGVSRGGCEKREGSEEVNEKRLNSKLLAFLNPWGVGETKIFDLTHPPAPIFDQPTYPPPSTWNLNTPLASRSIYLNLHSFAYVLSFLSVLFLFNVAEFIHLQKWMLNSPKVEKKRKMNGENKEMKYIYFHSTQHIKLWKRLFLHILYKKLK